MPDSIANIKGENNELRCKVSTLTEETSRLKDFIQQQGNSAAPSSKETSHSLEFLRNEYDEFLRFKPLPTKSCNAEVHTNSQRSRPK